MNIISVISIAFIITILLLIIVAIREKNNETAIVLLFINVLFGILLYRSFKWSDPKAIDVYRGKTQLVLDYNTDGTYDSIVVWKGCKK